MSVAEALETVYTKINDVLVMINDILDSKSIERAYTFYDLPERISMISGADEIIEGTVTKMTSVAKSVQPYKFYHCDSLRYVSMPAVTRIGDFAFYRCSNMANINLPSVESIGHQAFSNSGITSAEFPNVVSIGGSTFSGCSFLESVVLPVLHIVESGAFYDCTNLKKVDLTNVNSISANSFTGCTALETLIIRKNGLCSLASVRAFDNSGISNNNGFIYVPQDYIDYYIGATNWTFFKNKIRPIESYPDITGYE